MGYNRINDEGYNPVEYKVEIYIKSDCPLTKLEAINYKQRIKQCFTDDSQEMILSCCIQENRTRGKTRINNLRLKDIYIKEIKKIKYKNK